MSSARKKRKNKQFARALKNGTARDQQNRKFKPIEYRPPAALIELIAMVRGFFRGL